MPSSLRILDGAALALTLFLLARLAHSRQKLPLPPGPPGLPLIGNALSLPTKKAWKTYAKWGQTYGPLTFVKLVNRPILIINSVQAAFDLLERRGQIYSDRPVRPLLQWTGGAKGVGNQSYNPRLQQMRRLIKSAAGKTGVLEQEPTLSIEVHRFLRRLLDTSSSMVENIQLASGSAILDIDYGHDVLDRNDPLLQLLVNGVRENVQLITERLTLAEFFPSLGDIAYLIPGRHFYKTAARTRHLLREIETKPFIHIKKQLATGVARSSFVSTHLNDPDLTSEKEEVIRRTSMAIFVAGHDTTVSGVYGAVLALMLYPEVQARAQAELDSVVGTGRLPTLQDRSELPYTVAVVKEALRWMPPTPECVPHRLREDDEYMGYHIPKDSSVIVNIRGICQDPAEYANPHIFDPTRFLGDKQERDPFSIIFGFGRRICPGQPFAEAAIFLYIAALLSTFKISQDKASSPIDREDISQLPTYPAPYACCTEIRSESARHLVNSVTFRDGR